MKITSVLPGARSRPPFAVELVAVLAAAAAATQVKTWAEGAMQPLGERLFPPSTAERQRLGADPADHPRNMPPQVLVEEVGRDLQGHAPSDDQREAVSEAVHWVMGVGAGAAFGLLAHRLPWVRAGHGALFGAILFAATHASLLPAIGVQASLGDLPTSWWVWEPGSHLVYGVATDVALSITDAVTARVSGG